MNLLYTSTVLLFIAGELALVYGCLRSNKLLQVAGAGIFLYFCIMALAWKPFPKAIDVYRGKTRIEKIYRDGKPVDSVVVWKEHFNCN
jgi:hypothetical protein